MAERPLASYALEWSSWCVWGPGTAVGIALLSAAIGEGLGVYDGVSALAGGCAVGLALLMTALVVQPWRVRTARDWMPWIVAAQMGTLVLSVIGALVAMRALGADLAALGFTGAGAFLLGQVSQTAAYARSDRAGRARASEEAGEDGQPEDA